MDESNFMMNLNLKDMKLKDDNFLPFLTLLKVLVHNVFVFVQKSFFQKTIFLRSSLEINHIHGSKLKENILFS